MKPYQLVKQDNQLVRSSYKISLAEKRLILLAIAKAKKDFRQITVTTDEYKSMFENSNPWQDLRDASERIWDRTIYNLDGHPDRKTRWVYDVKFNEKDGEITFKFPEDLDPYLFDLKANFTKLELHKVASLGSSYSVRFFELLMQFKSTGEVHITVEQLREHFGIRDKYARYPDFKRRCITPVLKELNEKSDYKVTMKEHKLKRKKVTSLSFFFTEKQQMDMFQGSDW